MTEPSNMNVDRQTIEELAPTGVLRAALNLGNPILVQKDPVGGQLSGVTIDMARDIAGRLGVAVEFTEFDSAGKVSQCAMQDIWDIAFLAIDPKRAVDILYSEPYVHIEGTYVVTETSSIHTLNDVDVQGVQVAVGEGTAYDLFLTRHLENAEIIRFDTSDESLLRFTDKGLEVAAGIRQPLEHFAQQRHGFRVLDGYFTLIEQAVGCPRGRERAATFLRQYVRQAKQSGLVAASLQRSGQPPLLIPPSRATAT